MTTAFSKVVRKNVGDVRLSLNSVTAKLKVEIDRAWELQESRNLLFRKFEEDTFRTLQTLNARLSRLEEKVDTSVVDRNQIGMLSECIAAHNERIQVLNDRSSMPHAADQWIVDSKFSGVYFRLAEFEKRLQAHESKKIS